jgi:hypothetical protein
LAATIVTFNSYLREVVPPIALVLLLDLAVMVVFSAFSGGSARIGTLRPLGTIPGKVAELVLVGSGVGLLTCIAARRLDLPVLTLAVAFVAMIDADHLLSVFGIAQPIRPAHTFAFLGLEVVALGLAFRRRPELVPLAVSAWFAHIAGDTGVFSLFAPFSFEYSPLGPYRLPFVIIAACFAIVAGYVLRRSHR